MISRNGKLTYVCSLHTPMPTPLFRALWQLLNKDKGCAFADSPFYIFSTVCCRPIEANDVTIIVFQQAPLSPLLCAHECMKAVSIRIRSSMFSLHERQRLLIGNPMSGSVKGTCPDL